MMATVCLFANLAPNQFFLKSLSLSFLFITVPTFLSLCYLTYRLNPSFILTNPNFISTITNYAITNFTITTIITFIIFPITVSIEISFTIPSIDAIYTPTFAIKFV